MRLLAARKSGELDLEFRAEELTTLMLSIIEAREVIRSDELYEEILHVSYPAATALFDALKATSVRFDTRRAGEMRAAGPLEIDAIIPAASSPHGPRVRLRLDDVAWILQAARIALDGLSSGPVGAVEYRVRVGVSVEQARGIIDDLKTIMNSADLQDGEPV